MEELQVGDTVQVKSWDSMLTEYGYNNPEYLDDSINTPFSFTPEMKIFCNNFFIIRLIKKNSNEPTEYFLNWQNGETIYFFFAEEMFIMNYKLAKLSLNIVSDLKFNEELL